MGPYFEEAKAEYAATANAIGIPNIPTRVHFWTACHVGVGHRAGAGIPPMEWSGGESVRCRRGLDRRTSGALESGSVRSVQLVIAYLARIEA